MGRKVHPIGFRLGFIRDWQARWYADKHYAEFLLEDVKLRNAIKARYREAAISLMEIERQAKDVSITLHTARPGIVIGRGGQRVDEMRQYLESLVGKRIRLNIQEIRQPELDAYLVARAIAEQIERRVAYRRAMKQSIFRTIQAGAKGIRISCAGRLGDAEIARRQTMHQGQLPLHTLRADIDYGCTEAHTTFGRIGVKVWIYKGEILPEAPTVEAEEKPEELAPVAEKPEEKAPAAKPEEKPEEPVPIAEKPEEKTPAVKPVKKTKEKPKEPVPVAEKPEEKTPAAKPVKKTKEKPAKPKARTGTKKAVSAKSEEKPAKAASPRRKKATTAKEPEKNIDESAVEQTAEVEPSTVVEKEENDAAT